MNSEIILVDDFYDIPFDYYKSHHDGKCRITDETAGKISQILDHPINIIHASNECGDTPGVMAHLECDWIGIIYLTLPLQAFGELGIKFYSHIATGLETFPTREEIIKYQIEENDFGRIFSSNPKLWKEYSCIPAKYNRMILYKGDYFHASVDYFGKDRYDGRLFQTFFFNTEK